jgi:hypothetical protein
VYVSIEFTAEELEHLGFYMDVGERVEEAVHGIVMMVLTDLDAQRVMDEEFK